MVRSPSAIYISRVINDNAEYQYSKQLALDVLDRQTSSASAPLGPLVVSIPTLEKWSAEKQVVRGFQSQDGAELDQQGLKQDIYSAFSRLLLVE